MKYGKLNIDEEGTLIDSNGNPINLSDGDFVKEIVRRFNAYDQMIITLNEIKMDKMLLRVSVVGECNGWINTIKFALGEDDKTEK